MAKRSRHPQADCELRGNQEGGDPIRKHGLQGLSCCDKGEKAQESFVYSGIPSHNCDEKLQNVDGTFDPRLLRQRGT